MTRFATPRHPAGWPIRRTFRDVSIFRPLVFAACAGIFTFAASGAQAWTERLLHTFCEKDGRCLDGIAPDAPLLEDAAGNLYGTTFDGGLDGEGVVFRLTPEGRRFDFNVLKRFSLPNGASPTAPVIIDTQGDLYGTAEGGPGTGGFVFELMRKGSKFQRVILYTFCSQPNCADGDNLDDGLTYAGQETGAPYDGTSPLYGTSYNGGSAGAGTVYELTVVQGQTTRQETVIHNFCSQANCADGANPQAGLVVDANGNLFGTTGAGGNAQKGGVIFELSPNGNTYNEQVLYTFCSLANCADGAIPIAPLTIDARGDLFGTTEAGGAYNAAFCGNFMGIGGCGTVFELRGSNYAVLHSFCADQCSDGAAPLGGVVLDSSSGDLFGTASAGGTGQYGGNGAGGTVFRLGSGGFKVLHEFCSQPSCSDGAFPTAAPTLDPSGRIFGTTYGGGSPTFSAGTVYELKR